MTTGIPAAFNTAEHTKLAVVDSAKIFLSDIILNPDLLQVVAQPSGFNWRVYIHPVSPTSGIAYEYWPYQVLETSTGPGWPPGGGIGPVVPPVTLTYWLTADPLLTPVGSKGIAVVGANGKTINLEYKRKHVAETR